MAQEHGLTVKVRVDESREKDEFLTGLLYIQSGKPTVHDFLHLVNESIATLPQTFVKPGPEALKTCMEDLM